MTGRLAVTRSAAVIALVAGLGVVTAAPAGAGFGSPTPAFDAYAQGVALDATLSNQSLPLGLVVEGIGPEASSHLTSSGQSDAEASFPYTGPVVPGLIGIFGGLYGVPVPPYPFQAASGQGDPPSNVNYPGVTLHAESGSETNVGSASVGSPATGGTADSRVTVLSDGSVRANADTAVNGIVIGSVARLSGVQSAVSVLADGSTGKLKRTSSLSIGRITIAGLAITVPKTTPGSAPIPVPIPGVPQLPTPDLPTIPLPFGGQTLPAPDIGFEDGSFSMTLPGFGNTKFAVPASAVLSAFQAAGVTMTYQPAKTTPTGIEGATFTFGYTAPSLPANQYFSGPVPVTFTAGRAVASVTLNPVMPDVGNSGFLPGGTGGLPAGADVPPATGVASAPIPVTAPPLGAGQDLLPVTQPAPAVMAPAEPSRVGTASRFLPAAGAVDLAGIYLVFVLVALAALVSMTTLRLLGVRSLWSS